MNPPFTVIYLAADHAGFAYKEIVKQYLLTKEYNVIDCGADEYVEGDDYPDYMVRTAKEVSRDQSSIGIIFGGTGEGEAIVANRFPHVRATVCYGGPQAMDIITIGRQHNDTNVLSIGARFVAEAELILLVEKWLNTPFSNDERHVRRLAKIKNIHTI
ncbi:MAG: hypothetical protein RJB39_613 [Candidatus Parcubacteria bacterium]|jgi:ribose 5-phosphate isomerase B